jgi:hypothetical protein
LLLSVAPLGSDEQAIVSRMVVDGNLPAMSSRVHLTICRCTFFVSIELPPVAFFDGSIQRIEGGSNVRATLFAT